MAWIEAFAFALGVINVTLVVRRSVWNYPFALAMVSLYAAVFWDARLYSDMLLQGFFFVVNLYGWRAWTAARANVGEIVVETMSRAARFGWTTVCVLGALGWGATMDRFTDASLPWWDAAIAVTSVVAQILLARRKLENWVLWIGVDVASIGLYAAKGLWLTMVLYGVFLVLAIWGLVDWRATRVRQRAGMA